jgi:hypothetical protein
VRRAGPAQRSRAGAPRSIKSAQEQSAFEPQPAAYPEASGERLVGAALLVQGAAIGFVFTSLITFAGIVLLRCGVLIVACELLRTDQKGGISPIVAPAPFRSTPFSSGMCRHKHIQVVQAVNPLLW